MLPQLQKQNRFLEVNHHQQITCTMVTDLNYAAQPTTIKKLLTL